MDTMSTTVEELAGLPADSLQKAAEYIHRLKLAGDCADEISLPLAIGLFVSEAATLGQAAAVAGLSQADFQRELGKRRIPMHYGTEELVEDLRVVAELVP